VRGRAFMKKEVEEEEEKIGEGGLNFFRDCRLRLLVSTIESSCCCSFQRKNSLSFAPLTAVFSSHEENRSLRESRGEARREKTDERERQGEEEKTGERGRGVDHRIPTSSSSPERRQRAPARGTSIGSPWSLRRAQQRARIVFLENHSFLRVGPRPTARFFFFHLLILEVFRFLC